MEVEAYMYSIGVDIGTSTTEIIISNISISTTLGPSLLPVTGIDEVDVIYRSSVSFTPLINESTIDFGKVREKVQDALRESGIRKEEIETGAVIITGETARKENASLVTETLSEYLGDFVVATAGPKLESVLAGQGSGICEASKKKNKRIINLDIGGGTLNAAVFDNGIIKESFAMDIGGRLIKINKDMVVSYISSRIQFILNDKNIPIRLGEKATWNDLENLCDYLAEACLQACGLKNMTNETKRLYITDIIVPESIHFVSVSGGVGEYVRFISEQDECDTVYDKALEFGDIGPILGKKITDAFKDFEDKLILPEEKIRATVIGAGSHSLSISGSTIGFDESILPIRNIPIIKSTVTPENWNNLWKETKPLINLYEEDVIALSIIGKPSPGYEELKILAKQIVKLYEESLSPIIILLKEDFAKALSQIIRIHTNCRKPVICLDKIHCEQGDYIDIGTPIGSAIPVVIKTLIYQT